MICQNCQANVDNDLVFCTSCGTRLSETLNQTPTVLINESIVTKTGIPKVSKPSSNLKWITLIIALIALPASLFAAYLIYGNLKQPQIVANNQTKSQNSPKTTKRQNSNSNNLNTNIPVNSADNSNISDATENTNSNANEVLDDKWIDEEAPEDKRTEIWNEQIEVDPENHYAVPFSVEGSDKIVANVKTLQGLPVDVFVYTQAGFDEHFPDQTYKSFGYIGEKNVKIEQYLIKEDYVLVFVNKSKKTTSIIGKAFIVKE